MKKLLIIILIFLFITFAGYALLLSNYNPIFKNAEFITLEKSLEISKKENLLSIITLYKEIHLQDKEKICPCDIVANNVDPFRHQLSPKNKIYSAKIQKEFTTDDCLKQYLLNGEYLHGNVGIKKASKYYFQKPFEKTTLKEKLTLLVMLENPALYNPEHRKEKIERKVMDYQKLFEK